MTVAEAFAESAVNLGTTGNWIAPASPISDPFASLCAPASYQLFYDGERQRRAGGYPATPNLRTGRNRGGRDRWMPPFQWYLRTVHRRVLPQRHSGKERNRGFDPGLYYVLNGMALDANSVVRPGTN